MAHKPIATPDDLYYAERAALLLSSARAAQAGLFTLPAHQRELRASDASRKQGFRIAAEDYCVNSQDDAAKAFRIPEADMKLYMSRTK